jgi:hypothetical protein
MKCAGYGALTGNRRHACGRVLVRRPERKRPTGRPRRRWKDNIKKDPREEGWGGIKSIYLAQDRVRWQALVKVVMNCWLDEMRIIS